MGKYQFSYEEKLTIIREYLENEELLEATGTLGGSDEDFCDEESVTELTETMGITITADKENRITDISVYFHTSCWGDSGLGEEDPEEYWSFGECFRAAAEFIERLF